MYCKQCHKKINKNTINCPYCGFNNSNDFEMGKTTEIDLSEINKTPYLTKEEKHHNRIIVIIVAILVIGVVIILKFNSLNYKGDTPNYTSTTTTEIITNKTYTIGDFIISYNNDFRMENNVLYYKENRSYSISFTIVDAEKYFELSTNNELLDTTLNEIECSTYALDNKYGYLIDYNNKKYHIEVNYLSEDNENIQSKLSNVLKTIKSKKNE